MIDFLDRNERKILVGLLIVVCSLWGLSEYQHGLERQAETDQVIKICAGSIQQSFELIKCKADLGKCRGKQQSVSFAGANQ